MWHDGAQMAAITPPAAPLSAPPPARHVEHNATVDFGGAVTHRDLVREKVRVDPVSLAHKKREAQPGRKSDPRGQHVDIKV